MSSVPYVPLAGEVWCAIPGYSERYEASSAGRLRRVKGKRKGERLPLLLATFAGDGGYVRTALMRNDGSVYKPGVHQLVAEAFLGPCPAGMEVDHLDRDKTNNRPGNLTYITHAENIRRARETGWNTPHGERCRNAKLTAEQVRAIRRDPRPQRVVAADHGVSGVAVCLIRQRKTWKGVED